jgi:nanoRNase/pAp phosphatase (c-di-AMP/oligoRNAs hydrolase)
MIIITHSDADGIISAHLIQKIAGPGRIAFASQQTIVKSLDYFASKKKEKLIILDIAPTPETLKKASMFKEVLWIDHHEKTVEKIPERINFIHNKMPSTAAVISEKFNIGEKLVEIANEIDTNNVKSQDAERLQDYISYIKGTAKGIIFQPLAKELIERMNNLSFLSFPEIALKVIAHKVHEKQRVESLVIDSHAIRDEKLVFVEPKARVSTYEILEQAKGDYIVILNQSNKGTKLEFRTGSDKDVLKLAKLFKGSGNLHAAAAFTDNTNVSNIKKKIVNFIKKKV